MRTMLASGGVALGFALACGGGGFFTVTPQDREAVYTANDLLRTHPDLVIDSSNEVWSLAKSSGTWHLLYEYRDVSDTDSPLLVSTRITVDADPEQAKVTYIGVEAGAPYGLWQLLERVPRDDLLTWGDEHECVLLLNEHGVKAGNSCVLRDGRYTMMWVVVGAVFTEPDEVTEALRPRLEKLATYDPEAITR
jgi:hypothetical protein